VVFEEVQSDLEAQGYEVQSFILPAAGVGAPHRRDRVWIVAYGNKRTTGPSRTSTGTTGKGSGNNDEPKERGKQTEQHFGYGNVCGVNTDTGLFGQEKRQKQSMGIEQLCEKRIIAYSSDTRLQRGKKFGGITRERQESYKQPAGRICTDWQNFPTQSPICNGDDGISTDMVRYILRNGGDCYTEEEAEKEAKRIISKVRAEGIKAGGNAIVHQVALQIFKAIEDFENQLQKPALRL